MTQRSSVAYRMYIKIYFLKIVRLNVDKINRKVEIQVNKIQTRQVPSTIHQQS